MATNTNVKKVQFEFHGSDGSSRRVIAAPALRAVAAFERQDAAGKWHQEPLQDVPPSLLMALGRMVADHDNLGVTVTVDGDTMDIGLDELDATDPVGFLAQSIPQLGAMTASVPVRHGWREGVTFPVELEESEALLLDAMIREKFMPERSHGQIDAVPGRLLSKMHRVLDKFRDKQRSDEEFAASLTDEEREVIRARRVNTGRKDK